jgi:hypothetical protein
MVLWSSRRAVGRDSAGDGVRPASAVSGRAPGPGGPGGTPPESTTELIDLTERAGWAIRIEPDPVRAAELAERFRSRAARVEAQRELERLRARHWSGERVLEEGRTEIEWWEHPDADPYAILGLLPGARIEDAAAARRRIAQSCHPDRVEPTGENGQATDPVLALRRMVAANAAYDRLRRALHPV